MIFIENHSVINQNDAKVVGAQLCIWRDIKQKKCPTITELMW